VQFTKLRLTGFKSFVDPTELELGQGLTGIVGPNGCGKSNLVEALRWVMGETSPKSLRGGAMDDVIFSGTQNRPSRNIAEVVLSIDNSDRTAPAAHNESPELEVSRHIERESGSTYRINGGETRARDVQMLFADLASGAHSPALVSQGRIGAIVNAKPVDRRALLEEAAGITGLHSRRHEAELRLRGAETNLERLDDVMQALEAQLQNMKRQARQARRYRRVGEQIRQTEAIRLHLLYSDAEERIRRASDALNEVERRVGELTEAVARANTAHVAAGEELPALRQTEAEAGARLHRLTVARDSLEQEERRIEEAGRQLEAQLAQIALDQERETSMRDDAGAALERLQSEKSALTLRRQGEEDAQAAAAVQVEEAGAALDEQERELQGLTDRLANLTARGEAMERNRAEQQHRLERLRDRMSEAERLKADLEIEIGADRRLQEGAEKLSSAQQEAETARRELAQQEDRRAQAEEATAAAREGLQKVQGQIAALDAEAAALAKMLSVSESDLWPPLVDAVRVTPGYETALGVALGDDLQAPGDEAAPVHWRTMPALSAPPALPEGATPLSHYVEAPAALARRLSQIGLVDAGDVESMRSALRPGQRLVSKDGGLWRWDGYTVQSGAETAAAARLAQRNRLDEIRNQRQQALPQLNAAEASLAAARERSDAAGRAQAAAREQVRLASEELERQLREHGAAERDAVARSSRLTALQENLAQYAQDIGDSETALEAAVKGIAALPPLQELRDELGEVRRKTADRRSALVEARNSQDLLRREAAQRSNRIVAIDGEIGGWQERRESAERHLAELAQRRQQAMQQRAELERLPAELAERRNALLDQIGMAETARSEAADALAVAEAGVADLEKALRQEEAAHSTAREDRVRAEAAVEQARERRGEIVERIREALECGPEDVLQQGGVELPKDGQLPGLAESETKLERLKRERDRLGAVNLRAEQEAAELEEQLETMQVEKEDLEGAIARLRRGISSLNREGRERLLAAFKDVDQHFQHLFVRLFGGGKAHLALTESEDPLEAGLEIMASPPGKRLQRLSLLSGGEQALTAMALLFAVFLTNPAPVCVLDEVDAPLDDANVERFCNLVEEIARTTGTRFLIITHHPYSMARMDRLFGVTMAERGVSQLVSIDLERAERLHASA
jgi:chromosome segregation protein